MNVWRLSTRDIDFLTNKIEAKVQVFWKGHTNLKKISHLIWRYWVFLAFSQCLNFIPYFIYRKRAIIILSSVCILFIGQKCLFNEAYDQERVVMACVWYTIFLNQPWVILNPTVTQLKSFLFKNSCFFLLFFSGITARKGQSCTDPRGIQGTCNYIFDSPCSNILRAIRTLGVTQELIDFLLKAIKAPCGFEQFDYTLCCVETGNQGYVFTAY